VFPGDEDRTDAGARTALGAPTPEGTDREAAAAAELLDRAAVEDWSLLLPSSQAVHDRRRSLRRNRRLRSGLALATIAGIAAAVAPRTTSPGPAPALPVAVYPSPDATPSKGHIKPRITGITDQGMIEAFAHGTVVGSGTTGGHPWQVRVVVYDRPGEVPASIKQQFFAPGDPVTTGHPVAVFGEYEAGVLTEVHVSAPPAHDIPDLDFTTAADLFWADDESDVVFSLPVGANVASVVVSSSPTAKRTFPTVEVQGFRFVSVALHVTVDEQALSLNGLGTVVGTRTLAARTPL
jgi:hypothetical protein